MAWRRAKTVAAGISGTVDGSGDLTRTKTLIAAEPEVHFLDFDNRLPIMSLVQAQDR
jgi:hypothetical protein